MKPGASYRAGLLRGVATRAVTLPAFKPKRPPSLADTVVEHISRVKGAEEHAQIVKLVARAKRYRLTDDTTTAIATTLRMDPPSIERNVDLLHIDDEVVWIEFADLPRRLYGAPPPRNGAAMPEKVGILIARDETHEHRFAVVTAWQLPDQSVRHSYAVASIDLTELSALAWYARNRHSSDPVDSMNRMIGSVSVVVPPGLGREIQVIAEIDDPDGWHNGFEETVRNATLDVTSEIPFLYAVLIALGTGQINLTSDDEWRHAEVAHAFAESRKLPFVRPKTGFARVGRKSDPEVVWHAP